MKRLSFFISLGISLLGVLIVQNLFEDDKYLGFVGITFVTPFILLSLFITYRYFLLVVKETNDNLLKFTVIFGSLLLLIFLAYFSYQYKFQVVKNTKTLFPPFNEKTYQAYLNFYTFAFIHTFSALLGSIFGMIKKDNVTHIKRGTFH